MSDPYDKLRRRAMSEPRPETQRSEAGKERDRAAAHAQAAYDAVRQRKGKGRKKVHPKKLIDNPNYIGRHRKDG